MDRKAIESKAHELHREIWLRREIIWPMGVPPPVAMLDPLVALENLGLNCELRDSASADGSRGADAEAAGFLDGRRGIVVISTAFSYEVQRFTAAHEAAHAVMHPWIGDKVLHRDLPSLGTQARRHEHDREADYFAACYLMPRKLVETEFALRFGSRRPMPLTEATLFAMRVPESGVRTVFSAPAGSLQFARLVASAEVWDRMRFKSMAEAFGVSPTAMAIRLEELGLVEQ
jgi:Zn-dependent peptidase ImmA (M78 family)